MFDNRSAVSSHRGLWRKLCKTGKTISSLLQQPSNVNNLQITLPAAKELVKLDLRNLNDSFLSELCSLLLNLMYTSAAASS